MRVFTILCNVFVLITAFSIFGAPKTPDNWGDFRIGLVNDNTPKINDRMKQAVGEGVQLMYRYRYINGGFDSTTNSMTWILPVVGWQISIGHMGLPNITVETFTDNAYEDTFFPYFFEHVNEFLDAGFIGFLVGKGIADDTDFANETEGNVGDRGWFFSHLKEFDKGRAYINVTKADKNIQHVNRIIFNVKINNNVLSVD